MVRVAYDLTLTTEKSLGVLALLGDAKTRAAVLGAIEAGNDWALGWLEDHSAAAREKDKVIPVRALKNRETERFAAKQREVADLLDRGAVEMAEAQLQIEHYWAGALRRAVIDGDIESGEPLPESRPIAPGRVRC